MTAILYSFRRCPYAMRARMALHVSELDYEHREILLRNKPQAMLDISPKGTVPVFVTQQGDVIDESIAVMRYALSHHDPQDWLQKDTEAQSFIKVIDGDFKHHLDRYKYRSRYDDTAKRGDVDLDHRSAAVKCLEKWEDALENTPFLLGDKASLADIATFPFIRQFAATEPDWWAERPLPATGEWLSNWLNSEIFKYIMKKHPLWEHS